MASSIRIYDGDSIDSLDWPGTAHGAQAKAYLPWMVKGGPQAFIDNTPVRMLALQVDDEVMPLVVADGVPGCASICHPVAHYVDYARRELGKEDVSAWGRLVRRLLPMLGWTLRTFGAQRVVYVNHWLWTTNPTPALTSEQVGDVTALLVREFPDRAIVIRSLNERLNGLLLGVLRDAGWRGVASRVAYFFDGARPDALRHRDIRRDLGLLERTDLLLVSGPFVEEDFDRMIALYRRLYIEKFTRMNPQFNVRFLRHVSAGVVKLHAFRRAGDGRIEAFWADFERDGVMSPLMIGYDLDAPRQTGLYRMTLAMMFREAVRRRSLLNQGAGAGKFKSNRGCAPTVEFDMVYTAHLPPHRRLPWWVLRHSYTAKRMEVLGG